MYTPHTVTLYNVSDDGRDVNITILRGVFLDIANAEALSKTGLSDTSAATLYVPFSVEAVSALTGAAQAYLPPKQYDRAEDKAGFWTIAARGTGSANDCFFIKGEVVEPEAGYSDLKDSCDYVYRVSAVDPLDFGSPEMQHWQVGGI